MNFFYLLLLMIPINGISQNSSCSTMFGICDGDDLTLQSGVSNSEPGNDYGCLGSQPNPSWFYMEVSSAGDLDFTLSAPSDIDFIVYGPFTDYNSAISNCGQLGSVGAPIVDCSYSGTSNETPYIPNAQVGELYVILVTNYANSVQNATFTQDSGSGSISCSIAPPTCDAEVGTFMVQKNGVTTVLDISLCSNESFTINSNQDYTLPPDTIPAPQGDGIYTGELMYLIYDDLPTSNTPSIDPNFTGTIISGESITSTNSNTDPIFQQLGLNSGTYYFVPVTGDDGEGSGPNDNGGLHWDKDNNGCYELGDPISVTYLPIQTFYGLTDCSSLTNGVTFDFSTIFTTIQIESTGEGDLLTPSINYGEIIKFENLMYNDVVSFTATDQSGCQSTGNYTFDGPAFQNVTVTDADDCPSTTDGNVEVTINPASGSGTITVSMNGAPISGPTYQLEANAGTIVNTILTDQNGCAVQNQSTIGSAGHYINLTEVTSEHSDELCFGDESGYAEVSATPLPSGNITTISWQDPNGIDYPGTATNNFQDNMMPGTWVVSVTDDIGCQTSIPLLIEEGVIMNTEVTETIHLSCFGSNDGTISVGSQNPDITFIWDINNPTNTSGSTASTQNNLSAGEYLISASHTNGCTEEISATLNQPNEILVTDNIANESCTNYSDGKIIIMSVQNAQQPINYIWDLGEGATNPNIYSNLALNLPAGIHNLKIVDQNNCEKLMEYEIELLDSIYFSTLDFENCTSNDGGYVSAEAEGGIGNNFNYLWTNLDYNDTFNGQTWSNIYEGTYQIMVTSESNCKIYDTLILNCLSLGYLENKLTDISIYPTLLTSTNEITIVTEINNNQDVMFFEIYNLNGQRVYKNEINNQVQNIVIEIASGEYIYKFIKNDETVKTGKLLKP